MNERKISAELHKRLEVLAVVAGVGSVTGVLLKMLADYEEKYPEDADAAQRYFNLPKLTERG